MYISKKRNIQSTICAMLSLASHGNVDARTLLERVMQRQKPIFTSFIGKESASESESDVEYYGWFSPEIQSRRLEKPAEHKLRPGISTTTSTSISIKSPPYTYWLQGDKKIMVTDVTLTPEAMKRHIESNAVFLGKLDKFCCRSYTKL